MSGRLPVWSCPGEPVAWGHGHGADHAEHMSGSAGRVVVEATDCGISDWSAYRLSAGIEGDAHDRPVGQHGVAAGHVDPCSLSLRATTQTEAELHVAVVGANDRNALVLGRVLYLIDVRAVAQSTFRQVCCDRVVGDIPRFGRRRTGDRFPNAGGAGEQVSAASGQARRWAVIATRYATVEEANRQNERLGVAGPATRPDWSKSRPAGCSSEYSG